MADITLISGSTLGNAEYVAEHLAEKLEEKGFSTKVLYGPELKELSLEGLWLLVTSTHGAGELPGNLQPLLEQIKQQQPDLSKIHFGAVGLGSSEYDIFCGAIKLIVSQLIIQGALQIGNTLEIDTIKHQIPEAPAEKWLTHWVNLL